jgi:hypothetical protein
MTVAFRRMQPPRQQQQRGITLFGLMFWAIVIGFIALVVLRVIPTTTEYFAIKKVVNAIVQEGASTVPEIRASFERRKSVEYGIESISGADLQITKINDKVVVSFAYDKEIELMAPVYLLIKYEGSSGK